MTDADAIDFLVRRGFLSEEVKKTPLLELRKGPAMRALMKAVALAYEEGFEKGATAGLPLYGSKQ